MRKPIVALVLIVLIVMAQLIASAPMRKSLRSQLNPNYVRAMAAYKRLEPRLPRNELRAITTIGILNGAKEAERQMEQNLVEVVKDLLLNTDMTDDDELLPKIERIEKQLTRDRRALTILTSALDLVTGTKDVRDFKADMQQTLQQIRRQSNAEQEAQEQQENGSNVAEEAEKDMGARVAALRRHILEQVNEMKALVEQKIEHTLDYLIDEADEDGLLAKASNKVLRKRAAGDNEEREEPAEIRMIKSILTEDDFRNNLVDVGPEKRNDILDSLEEDLMPPPLQQSKNVIANRSSSSATTTLTTTTRANKALATTKPTTKSAALEAAEESTATTLATPTAAADDTQEAKQEDNSPEIAPEGNGDGGGGGGGLVGIISSLSGGEGGSDIGALIGALTGVVSTLFGPGGLDIESLISTATSLISGLLAGNKNFGTVLGQYVGTAVDGLSGGGGAERNGQFFGNFLGTLVASLSADPEEDDAPPNPILFTKNLINSFIEAKNRKASSEETEERKGDASYAMHSHHKGGAPAAGGGGSDSGGFIKHIVSHLVGSAVSLILNASLGASGGASHASASLFGASSHKHGGAAAGGGGGAGGGVKSW